MNLHEHQTFAPDSRVPLYNNNSQTWWLGDITGGWSGDIIDTGDQDLSSVCTQMASYQSETTRSINLIIPGGHFKPMKMLWMSLQHQNRSRNNSKITESCWIHVKLEDLGLVRAAWVGCSGHYRSRHLSHPRRRVTFSHRCSCIMVGTWTQPQSDEQSEHLGMTFIILSNFPTLESRNELHSGGGRGEWKVKEEGERDEEDAERQWKRHKMRRRDWDGREEREEWEWLSNHFEPYLTKYPIRFEASCIRDHPSSVRKGPCYAKHLLGALLGKISLPIAISLSVCLSFLFMKHTTFEWGPIWKENIRNMHQWCAETITFSRDLHLLPPI